MPRNFLRGFRKSSRRPASTSKPSLLLLEDRTVPTLVTITGTEVWDGVANPHAADGVVLSGSAGNFNYAIPNGMNITGTGLMTVGTTNNHVTLTFASGGGGLTLNGNINVTTGQRTFTPGIERNFTLAMNNNNITGTGDITSTYVIGSTNNKYNLVITGTGNVAFDDINFLHSDGGLGGNVDINVSGTVSLDQVNTADDSGGGGPAENITIRAAAITVGAVSTFAARDSTTVNGNVTLEALAPPSFSTTNAAGNSIANVLTINGPMDVEGSGQNQGGGNITLRAVKIVVASGFTLDQEGDSTRIIEAGEVKPGFPANALFVNGSAVPLTASHVVQWTPPAGGAAPVTISTAEVWDGILNPHAADGVVLSGSGNNFTYTIPLGVTITAAGTLSVGTANNHVTLNFAAGGGGLALNGNINLTSGLRDGAPGIERTFTLAMNNNSITGTGDILSNYVVGSTQNKHNLTITGTGSVTFDDINFLHSDGGPGGNVDINVSGTVTLDSINTSDDSAGGGPAENITIRASAITVGALSAFAARDSSTPNGNITLEALAPPSFSTTNAAGNSSANVLNINGPIDVEGNGQNQAGGNVTLRGVKINVANGFTIDQEGDSTRTIEAGEVKPGFPASSLFVNNSGTPLTASHTVQWTAPNPVTVSGPEVWDGVQNPHTADGVTLSGSGNSFTYTIPAGMVIAGGGVISVGTLNNNVTLSFAPSAGGLTLNGAINLSSGQRTFALGVERTFTLAMNNNPITGTGDVLSTYIVNSSENRHNLSITGTSSVALDDINLLHSDGGLGGNVDINVSGSVTLDQVNTSDDAGGGGAAENITIRASSITVGAISAFSARGGAPAENNGNVTLEALAPPSFSTTNAAGNNKDNLLTINGPIDVEGAGQNQGGGNVTLRAVKIVIASGFTIDQEGDSVRTIQAGEAKTSFPTSALFVNNSATALTASHTVQWTPPGIVTISTAEVWDGVQNPHAADGVVLSGSGGSFTYTIPAGMIITSTGTIGLGTTNNNIALSFAPTTGGLTLNGAINVSSGQRTFTPGIERTFTLAMNDNPITGTGDILSTYVAGSSPNKHNLVITGTSNVAFDDINFLHSDGGLGGNVDITVSGSVTLDTINTSDDNGGGGAAENITIRAASITVGAITAACARTGSAMDNGNVTLEALAPPSFSVTNAAGNSIANVLNINGPIDVEGAPALNQNGGNVTLRGVKIVVAAGFTIDQEGDAVRTIEAGQVKTGFPASALFVNNSATPLTASHTVQWTAPAPVTITALEVWDGIQNPHAADGVILSGSGGNFTYTIPAGMTITPSGTISLGTANNNVTLSFAPGAGGLTLNGAINTTSGLRDNTAGLERTFTLAMNDNNITGTGDVLSTYLAGSTQNKHNLSITGTGNVAFDDVNFLHSDGGQGGNVSIIVSGTVTLDSINTSDDNGGGEHAENITIRAAAITVGATTATSARDARNNGNITLEALAPPSFSATNAAGNAITNVLTINGPFDVEGLPGFDQPGGNVTLRAVKIVIASGFTLDQEGDATRIIEAGQTKPGFLSTDLFVNNSATPLTASHIVQWTAPVGAATLSAALDGSNNLVITDTDATGKNNTLSITNDGAGNIVITDAVEQFISTGGIAGAALSNGNRTLTVPVGSIGGTTILVQGNGGNDAVTVSLANALGKTLTFNGGTGADNLAATGGTFASATLSHTNASDGSVVLGANTVNYTGLDSATSITGTVASLTVNLPDIDDATDDVTQLSIAGGVLTIDSTNGEHIDDLLPSAGITSLTINGRAGDDTITLASSLSTFTGALTVDGGAGTDDVNLNATLSLGANSLSLAGETIDFATINVTTTSGNQTYNGLLRLAATGPNSISANPGTVTLGGGVNLVTGSTANATFNASVVFSGSQALDNDGSGLLLFNGPTNSGTGSPTLTNTGSGTGNVHFQSVLTNTIGSMVQNSATSNLILRLNNDGFSSLQALKGAAVFGNGGTVLGTGPVTLGNSAGGTDAAALMHQNNGNDVYANPIVLAPTTTGLLTIGNLDDSGVFTATFTGGVTGNNSFTIENRSTTHHLAFSTGALNNAGTITHTGTGTGNATINSAIGPNVTGVIQNSGTSQLILGGVNTYTAVTTVSAGTLLVTGSLVNGPAAVDVVVAGGATLGGTGNIGGVIGVNAGGTLSPGNNGIGVLSTNLSPVLAGTVAAQINKTGAVLTADKLNVGAALTYGGTLTVTRTGDPLAIGDVFDLFDATSFSGVFATFNLPAAPVGAVWNTSLLTVNGSIRLDASNTAPTVAANSPTVAANEPNAAMSGTYNDPDPGNVTITASAGSITKTGTNSGTWSWSLGSLDGPITTPVTVTITANDNTGTPNAITTTTFTYTVANLPPVINTFTVSPGATEGGTISGSASATDPAGALDPLTYTWTVAGPGIPTTLTFTGTSFSTTALDNGSYSVSLVVSDGDGGSANQSANVPVLNANPNFELGPDETLPLNVGSFARGPIAFTDAGTIDTWTATVNYGDGAGAVALPLSGMSFSLAHNYIAPATYTVTVVATDDDLGSFTDSFTVTVQAPTVVYVDDAWAGFTPGASIADADPVAAGNQAAVFGFNAHALPNAAIAAVAVGGNVLHNAGTYNQAAVINKALTYTFQEGAIVLGSLGDTVLATINLGVALTVGGNNGSTTLSSPMAGGGSLTKTGTGVMALTGAAANTFSGGTTVADGTLALAKSAGVDALAGPIVIGDTVGGSATVKTAILRIDQSNQIPDAAVITFMGNDGRLFLAAGSETIATPAFAAGDMKIAGALTTTGDYALPAGASTTMAGGSLHVGATGTLDFTLAGTLQGSGTIYTKMLTHSGVIDPSSGLTDADIGNASPGRLTVRGNLNMTAGAVTNLDVGPAGDQLNVGINTALPLPAGSYTDLSNYDLDPYLRGDVLAVTEPGRRGVNDIYNVNGTVRVGGALNTRPIGSYAPAANVTSGNAMNFVWRALNITAADLNPRSANLSSLPSDFSARNVFTAAGAPVSPTAPAGDRLYEARFMGSAGQANAIGQAVSVMTKLGGVDLAVLTAPALSVGQAKALTLTSLTAPATSNAALKMTKQLWNALRDSHTRVTVTVTNTGATPLTGPFYLEITATPFSVPVFNAGGKTQANRPYLVVVPRDAAGNALTTLAAGAAATVEVDLLTPVTLGKTTALSANVLFGGMP